MVRDRRIPPDTRLAGSTPCLIVGVHRDQHLALDMGPSYEGFGRRPLARTRRDVRRGRRSKAPQGGNRVLEGRWRRVHALWGFRDRRGRNGLMALSVMAIAPVSHEVTNPIILRQDEPTCYPAIQHASRTLRPGVPTASGLVRGSIPAVWRAEPAGRQVSISGHYDGALSVGNKEVARAAYGGPLAGFVRAQLIPSDK